MPIRIVDTLRLKVGQTDYGRKAPGNFQAEMERWHLARAAHQRRKLTKGSGVAGFNSKLVPSLDRELYRNQDQEVKYLKATRS